MHHRIIEFTVAATVLYLSGNGVSAQEVGCHQSYEEMCYKPVEGRLPNDSPFFPSDTELKEICEPILTMMRCTVEFNKTCPFTKADFEPILGLEELIPLVEDICDENSSLGKRYREHIECISDIKDNIKDIISDSSQQLMEFVKKLRTDPLERLQSKQWRAIHCTSDKYTVGKLLALTFEECGTETTMFMAELVSRILTPYKIMCPEDDEEIQEFVTVLEQSI